MASATPDLRLPSQPQGITAHWLVSNYTAWWQRHMCVNNLPRVALDSGEARIRTRDLLIASPASVLTTRHRVKYYFKQITEVWSKLCWLTKNVIEKFSKNRLNRLTNHSEYSKCPPLAWTHALRHLRHWSMASSITHCSIPFHTSIRRCLKSSMFCTFVW